MQNINNIAPSQNVLNPNGLSNKPFCSGAALFNNMDIVIHSALGLFKCTIDDNMNHLVCKYKWFYSSGYAMTKIKGSRTYMHRLIMGAVPGEMIDHINGNTLDNRLCNLRFTNKSLNSINSKKRVGTSSKYRGVTWHAQNKRWLAQTGIKGKHISIGCFKNEVDAAIAYNNYMINLYGSYAKPNEIKE